MLTGIVYQAAIHDVLVREFGHLRHKAKVVAQLAQSTPKAAQNWFDGLCAPQGAALLNLMASCEAVDLEMERLKKMARDGLQK